MVVAVSPQGVLHASVIERLNLLLIEQFGRSAKVRPQLPFAASGDSLPEPDLAVTPLDAPRNVHPSRALRIVEVAETSLDTDRAVNSAVYAAADVPEYWIVDVRRKVVEVYTEAQVDHYGAARIARSGDVIELVAAAGKSVVVAEIFAA